jgi:hypothetical protein
MSAFEISLTVGSASLVVPDEETIKAGTPPHVEIRLGVVQPLPFSEGPGAPPVMAHIADVKYRLDPEMAVEFFEKGLAAAKTLPKSSGLEVATNLSAVEEAAKRLEKLKG